MRRKLPPFLHHYRRTHLRIIVTVNVLHIIWRLICRLCLYGAVLWLPVANTPMKLEGGSLRRSKHVLLRLLRDCIIVSGSLDNLYNGDVLTFHSFVDNTDCANQLQVVLSVDMEHNKSIFASSFAQRSSEVSWHACPWSKSVLGHSFTHPHS